MHKDLWNIKGVFLFFFFFHVKLVVGASSKAGKGHGRLTVTTVPGSVVM